MSVTRAPPRQQSHQDPARSPGSSRGSSVLTLMAALAALTASGMGLGLESAYRASEATTQMLRGYDLVTLVLVVPLLVFAQLQPDRRLLLRSGLLAYLVYSYLFAAVTGGLGVAFLLDIAVLCAATFGLGLTLIGLRAAPVAAARRVGSRVTSVVLGVLALSLGGMWLSAALQAAATGAVPEGSALVESGLAVRLGITLDLWLLVPLYGLTALLLWRRRGWGRILGVLAVVSGLLHQLSYMTALVFQAGADVPGARAFDPFEPVIVAGYLVALVPLLGRHRVVAATAPRGVSDEHT